ncbi:MAG: LicD family protein [Spirochaetales bacterium]|nr:LicD family protein [Candidatus Physcosoma equi]
MEKKTLTNAEIKEELLSMMVSFDAFMKEHDISYTIMSGTLLGAVRHGGFIPWDDDLDLGLKRSEYEKLLDVLKKENRIGDNLYAVGCELGNGTFPFLKILNPKIEVLEERQEAKAKVVIHGQSLWLDIFPFDYMPCRFQKPYLKLIRLLRRQKNLKQLCTKEFLSSQRGLKGAAYRILNAFNNIFSDTFYSRCIVRISKWGSPESNLIGDLTWGRAGIDKCFSPALFDDITTYRFENAEVKGFRDYDTYLKQIYGDYMKLPPKEKQVNHGLCAWWRENDEE